jgi:hypothetical protein
MPSIRVHLKEATARAPDRVVEERGRAEFIRSAIIKAIREAEYEHARMAYAAQPDSESEADDWSNCEEYKV